MTSYKLTSDTTADVISASGAEQATQHTLAAGTIVQVAMSSSDVLTAMGKGGTVAAHAPDGTIYAVPASSLAPAESSLTSSQLYLVVGAAIALVAFMYWNTNRR